MKTIPISIFLKIEFAEYLFHKMSDQKLEVILQEGAKFGRATTGAAGYDLCSMETVNLKAGVQSIISTGVQVSIPPGYCGLLFSRSSFAMKAWAVMQAGVIDSDYRGEIKVMMLPFRDYCIEKGERIAQMVIMPHFTSAPELVKDFMVQGDHLGFGSTGK